jgi:hypothetical protein
MEDNRSNPPWEPDAEDIDPDVLAKAVAIFRPLTPDARRRLLATLTTFFNIVGTSGPVSRTERPATSQDPAPFSEDRTLSPKVFLLDKRPVTDIERMTCLAYYLTHYRDTVHFKTLDLSKLNTEAAQIKFSNSTKAVSNAVRAGLLVSAGRGQVQISALGEVYVQALPNRDAARAAIRGVRPRRRIKKPTTAAHGA